MNKFEFHHYPRRYGKTHKLVDNMFDEIYKTNAKRIVIFVSDKEQVTYLSDVITCNLDYQYQHTKRYKGTNNNKFVCAYKDRNYVIIVGTYKFFNRDNRKSDGDVDLVLFDELLFEDDIKRMERIILKYPKAIFKAFYTSNIGPFNKTIFHMFLIKKCDKTLLPKIAKYYSPEYIGSELERMRGTIYDSEIIDYTIKQEVTIDKFEKYINNLQPDDFSGIDTIERVFSTQKEKMFKNYFGVMLVSKYLERRVEELYNKFIGM